MIAWNGLDRTTVGGGIGGVDRDDVEGEAWGGRGLREQAGSDEERGELHGEIVARRCGFTESSAGPGKVEKQIPCGNDRKKGKSNGTSFNATGAKKGAKGRNGRRDATAAESNGRIGGWNQGLLTLAVVAMGAVLPVGVAPGLAGAYLEAHLA